LALTWATSTLAQVENPVLPNVTAINYLDGDATLLGHLASPDKPGRFPAIIIIPDWDGVNEYEQVRATLIAQEWGFVAFAADIYGSELQYVENITERGQLATYYRSNPTIFGSRINAAINYVKGLEQVDADHVALFGYCFGGTGVLQYGLYGHNDVSAIVSFHGGLSFLPEEPLAFGPKVLVLSGGEDDATTDIMDLEITLDTANATWEITRFSGVEHAFTVYTSEDYHPWADKKSWDAAYTFISEVFGLTVLQSAEPNNVTTLSVDYMDDSDGAALLGHVAIPDEGWIRPLPAVVILPNWDGANTYEQERASALAEMGYVAMVADIYGEDLQFVEKIDDRIALTSAFASNPELYFSRIQKAIDQVKLLTDDVNVDEIAIVGYCFGGSGAVLYSFLGGDDVKVAVAFHGSFTELPPVETVAIAPYLLVLSGGDDGLHGNQTIMEEAFNSGNATWEITRYSGVDHGFTEFGDAAYDLVADARSWESMLSTFQEYLAVPQRVDEEEGSETISPQGPGDKGPEASSAWSFTLQVAALVSIVMTPLMTF